MAESSNWFDSVSGWTTQVGGVNTEWAGAVGATVLVDWTFPNGSTRRLDAITSSSGVASFEVQNAKKGTHCLGVVDVVYLEHPFDRELSMLTSSIKVK